MSLLTFSIKEITLLTSNSKKTASPLSADKSMNNTAKNVDPMMPNKEDKTVNGTEFTPTDLAKQMQQSSQQASQLLKSLSHPDRLLLLCQLTQGEYCVGELETLVGVGQPSLSQQLGILRKDELVATRREGKQIYYSIASEDALAVLQLLYQRFCAKED